LFSFESGKKKKRTTLIIHAGPKKRKRERNPARPTTSIERIKRGKPAYTTEGGKEKTATYTLAFCRKKEEKRKGCGLLPGGPGSSSHLICPAHGKLGPPLDSGGKEGKGGKR